MKALVFILLIPIISCKDPCSGVQDLTYVSSENSCEEYYLCFKEAIIDLKCRQGLWFHSKSSQCINPEQSDCPLASPAPDSSEKCENVPNFSFVSSDVSCRQYYQCINDDAYLLSCPQNQWFNEKLQKCDLPSNVDCDLENPPPVTPVPTPSPPILSELCDNKANFLYVRDNETCHLYYQCIHGVAYLLSCPKESYFDEARQLCDDKENVECEIIPHVPEPCEGQPDGKYVPHPASCSMYFVCVAGIGYPSSCMEGLWFDEVSGKCDLPENSVCHASTPPPPTTEAPGICEHKPDETFVAHPDSCSLYYVCVNEKPFPLLCSSGYWFDEKRSECHLPEEATCNAVYPEVCEGIENGVYIPNPTACNLYFVCEDGDGDAVVCPPGLWFDEENQQCDIPENVLCGFTTIEPPTTVTHAPGICSGVENGYHKASPVSCSEYYVCINEVAYPSFCDPSLWFDEERQICDLPENVNCGLATTPAPGPCEHIPDGTFVPFPTTCSMYNVCVNNKAYPISCPQGLWFDEKSSKCHLPEEATCNALTPDVCEGYYNGYYLANPIACNTYYICEDGDGSPVVCPAGLWFDEENQQCDIPGNVQCAFTTIEPPTTVTPTPGICVGVENGVFKPSPVSCSKYYVCANDIGYPAECDSGFWFDEELQTCDDPGNATCPYGPCAGVESGVYVPSPISCEHYFICADNKGFLVQCPAGLWFDKDNQKCDEKENVHCAISKELGKLCLNVETLLLYLC